MQRKCCRHRGKRWPRPFKTARPLLPPPEPRRPSTASALPNWGQPLSDCTIFFAAHPRAEMSAHSAACRESGPCLGIPPSGSRSPGVSEVNGRGWGREAGSLCFPSPSPPLAAATSGPRGLGGCWAAGAQAVPGGLGKSPGPGAGARGSRCRALSLGRRALQPWLKPTDENTECAAKS